MEPPLKWWTTEYLDLILAVKVVDSLEEAIAHQSLWDQTFRGHCDGDYSAARCFMQAVDAAAVYVNASTRFTDGNEFGLGAEIGISTQTLHARGPMGLGMTTTKYIIQGNGQVR